MERDTEVEVETDENQELLEAAEGEGEDVRAQAPVTEKRQRVALNLVDKTPPRSVPAAKKVYDRWSIDRLRPHPLQAELPGTRVTEDQDLLDDIRRNGLLEPIEVTADATVISGHRRWKAARQLGHKEVKVLIRHDLEAEGEDAVNHRFYEANLHRRQLSASDMVGLYVRLRQLAPRGSQRRGQGSLRDELAKRFRMTGRHLDRWARLHEGPPEIRAAVEKKQLPLVTAVELLTQLDAQRLARVVRELRRNFEPRAVAREALEDLPRPTKPISLNPRSLDRWFTAGLGFLAQQKQLGETLDEERIKQLRQLSERLRKFLAGVEQQGRGDSTRPAKRKPK